MSYRSSLSSRILIGRKMKMIFRCRQDNNFFFCTKRGYPSFPPEASLSPPFLFSKSIPMTFSERVMAIRRSTKLIKKKTHSQQEASSTNELYVTCGPFQETWKTQLGRIWFRIIWKFLHFQKISPTRKYNFDGFLKMTECQMLVRFLSRIPQVLEEDRRPGKLKQIGNVSK